MVENGLLQYVASSYTAFFLTALTGGLFGLHYSASRLTGTAVTFFRTMNAIQNIEASRYNAQAFRFE